MAVVLAIGVVPGVSFGEEDDAGEAGGWREAMPPGTTLVAKMESEAFETFARAFTDRIEPGSGDQLFAAESPISAAVAAWLTGEFDDFIEGDSDVLTTIEFEHVDDDRPLVFAMSVARHAPLLEAIGKGLPPTDAGGLVDGPLMRRVVPA